MKRDLQKYVEEYNKRYLDNKNGKCAIYGTDINQIYIASSDPFDMIAKALKAGIIIGYNAGKKEMYK